MEELIEKLKENTVAWAFLSIAKRTMFESLLPEDVAWLDMDGKWSVRTSGSFAVHRVYRIRPAYQPEPGTPVFPGYVAVLVGWDSDIEQIIDNYKSLGKQFAGYVFKEEPDAICSMPAVWVLNDENCLHYHVTKEDIQRGYVPATLGWVVFREGE